ncbi:MAG: hypothetical protein WD154_02675 [Nitrosopumilaceae archaeon]
MSSENKLAQIKQKIECLHQELVTINQSTQPMPELINTTNILRTNEYLTHVNEKKTEIVSSYEEYVKELERFLSSVLERKLAFLKKTHARLQKRTKKKPIRKRIKKSKKKKSSKKRKH